MGKRPDLALFNKSRKIPLESVVCKKCGVTFNAQRSSNRKYCSQRCYFDSCVGRKNPNAVKAMIKSTKGKPADWNKDPVKIEKQRAKMLGRKRPEHSKRMLREENPNWNGGKSYELYGFDWTDTLKHSIRIRDLFKCKMCGSKGWVVHHIDYNKKNCNPTNLVTLCVPCHMKTNFNRDSWIKFFESKEAYVSKENSISC